MIQTYDISLLGKLDKCDSMVNHATSVFYLICSTSEPWCKELGCNCFLTASKILQSLILFINKASITIVRFILKVCSLTPVLFPQLNLTPREHVPTGSAFRQQWLIFIWIHGLRKVGEHRKPVWQKNISMICEHDFYSFMIPFTSKLYGGHYKWYSAKLVIESVVIQIFSHVRSSHNKLIST